MKSLLVMVLILMVTLPIVDRLRKKYAEKPKPYHPEFSTIAVLPDLSNVPKSLYVPGSFEGDIEIDNAKSVIVDKAETVTLNMREINSVLLKHSDGTTEHITLLYVRE